MAKIKEVLTTKGTEVNYDILEQYVDSGEMVTYKQLCEILDIPYCNSGNAKKKQIDDIDRYYHFEKTGTKYQFLEKRETSLQQKEDKRYGKHEKTGRQVEYKGYAIPEDKDDSCGVYCITLGNKIYVGSTTTTFRIRYRAYVYKIGQAHVTDLIEAGGQYTIIWEANPTDDEITIRRMEQIYIDLYKADPRWELINERAEATLTRIKWKQLTLWNLYEKQLQESKGE